MIPIFRHRGRLTGLGLLLGGTSPGAAVDAHFYQQKVVPVLEQYCFECHQSGRKRKGGLAVDALSAMMQGGDSGPALVPGAPEKSLLYTSLTHVDPEYEMPPDEKLPAPVIEVVRQWIEAGAPGPAPSTGTATARDSHEKAAPRVVTLTGIGGGSVEFTDTSSGSSGRGRFRRMGTDASPERLPLATHAIITSAAVARRTQDILIGIELSHGIRNPAFEGVEDGNLRARIVTENGEITELNLITADSEDTVIAVKPKRPPLKPHATIR